MFNPKSIVWGSLFSVVVVAIAPNYSYSEDFQSRVLSEVVTPNVLTGAEIGELNDLQFILVDGTFGELFNSNFDPAVDVIHHEWPNAEVVVIRPHTPNSIPTNAEILFQQIRDFRTASHKTKAIVVAHSKGAAEVTLMALKHPELISAYGVQNYGMVSGPIGGTNVIDFVTSSCEIGSLLCDALGAKLPFLATFTPDVIQPIFAGSVAVLTAQQKADFASKIFYVRTQMTNYDAISPLYATHLYLSLHQHEYQNDGLIPTGSELLTDSSLPGAPVLGTDLGVMIGDHNSLLNKGMTQSTRDYREAFFRSLIERMVFGEITR